LAVADSAVSRNWRAVIVNASLGIVLGLVGGAVVGSFINDFYNYLGGGSSEFTVKQVFARAAGWAVLGLFLAIAPGVLLRSVKRFSIGLAGGIAGGLAGGLCFDILARSTSSAVFSRFVAVVAIGMLAGTATGLIENVAKSGWLRVTAGLIAGKQFILYRDPTIIGSSPQAEIYLFKDPQISAHHAAIHRTNGGFEIEDLASTTATFVNARAVKRARLRSGDTVQIGSTTLLFEEKAS
jgi:Ca-activated chloride channel family protein